jgi:hypothetical protein
MLDYRLTCDLVLQVAECNRSRLFHHRRHPRGLYTIAPGRCPPCRKLAGYRLDGWYRIGCWNLQCLRVRPPFDDGRILRCLPRLRFRPHSYDTLGEFRRVFRGQWLALIAYVDTAAGAWCVECQSLY